MDIPKVTENAARRRWAMMLRIKSDFIMGVKRKAGDYSRMFGCTCITKDDVEYICSLDSITLEDALCFVNATTYKTKISHSRALRKKNSSQGKLDL